MTRETPRSGSPTLIGMTEADPFPLTPYADVHVYTPSRERAKQESTPVYIPPARRFTPQELEVRRVLRRSSSSTVYLAPRKPISPIRFWPGMLLCMVILCATLLILFAVF